MNFHEIGSKIKNNISVIILSAIMLGSVIFALVSHYYVHKNENDYQKSETVTTTTTSSATSKKKNTSTTTITATQTTKRKTTTKKSHSIKTTKEAVEKIDFPIDINTATIDDLVQIPNIGKSTAEKIIEYRESVGIINNFNLLLNINGIGEKTLETLKEYLYIENEYSSKVGTTAKLTTTKPVTVTYTEEKRYTSVNINTASAKEISDCLLIDMNLARKIIQLRNKIGYFSNSLELLYVENFTEEMYSERKNYIEL